MRLGIIAQSAQHAHQYAPHALILVWLLACAFSDIRKREVPNWLTLPMVSLGIGYRLLLPDGWLPWALAGAAVALTLADALPGGDMKGLVAMALFDPRLYLLAWLGAGIVYLLWRVTRRERWMPGYLGFAMGAGIWLFVGAQV